MLILKLIKSQIFIIIKAKKVLVYKLVFLSLLKNYYYKLIIIFKVVY